MYRDWLYRRKISKKFWRAKLGRGCWRYRRPIGRDDTREWPVWAWYRSWPYRRKFGSRKCVKTRGKNRILHESGREKSPGAGNQKFPSKSTIPDSILMVPEVKSRLNEPKPVKSGQKSDFIFFHIFRGGRRHGRSPFKSAAPSG